MLEKSWIRNTDATTVSECEMSSLHGLLSQIPQDLPFEKLLVEAQLLFELHPPHTVKEHLAINKYS